MKFAELGLASNSRLEPVQRFPFGFDAVQVRIAMTVFDSLQLSAE